jgi:hypothetical protein
MPPYYCKCSQAAIPEQAHRVAAWFGARREPDDPLVFAIYSARRSDAHAAAFATANHDWGLPGDWILTH